MAYPLSINLNLRFTVKQRLLVFALTVFSGVYGLAQSGTELPSKVQQRPDGSFDFIPPIEEEVTVNEEAPNPETLTPNQNVNSTSSQQSVQNATSGQREQTCEKLSHCEPDEMRVADVCFFQRRFTLGHYTAITGSIRGGSNFSVSRLCPPDMGNPEILHFPFYLDPSNNIDQISKKLDEVAKRCARIRGLYFITDGYSGSTAIGLNNNNVTRLNPYSCLMTKNSVVDLSGSPIGKGCSGKFLMQQVAENLFQDKPGTIISPNQQVVSVIDTGVRVNRTVRAFGYNELKYTPKPSGSPQLTWRNLNNTASTYRDTVMAGRARSRPDQHSTLQEACRHDIEQRITSIRRQQRELTDNRGRECSRLTQCPRTPYNDVITRARSIASRIRPNTRSLQQASNTHSQLLSIESVLSQCHSSTPHTGCDLASFLNRNTTPTVPVIHRSNRPEGPTEGGR